MWKLTISGNDNDVFKVYPTLYVALWTPQRQWTDANIMLSKDSVELHLSETEQAQSMFLLTGLRRNDHGQLCEVIIGMQMAPVLAPDRTEIVEFRDAYHRVVQASLRIHMQKPSETSAKETRLQEKKKKKKKKIRHAWEHKHEENEGGVEHKRDVNDDVELFDFYDRPDRKLLVQAKPVVPVFDNMIRGMIIAPWGSKIPLLRWLQHVTREAYGHTTQALYFVEVVLFYMKWRGISLDDLQPDSLEYTELLQCVCGHHVWSQPYCADECIDSTKGSCFRACDTFATSRWIAGPYRCGDCEDYTADIIATFHALRDIRLDACKELSPRGMKLLHDLRHMARCYTALACDTVLLDKDGPRLHLYVKLVPSGLLAEEKNRSKHIVPRAERLPILLLDSTRRSWTPSTNLLKAQEDTLRKLYRYLRITPAHKCQEHARDTNGKGHPSFTGTCSVCSNMSVSMLFSWPTPAHLWQEFSLGQYHTDLRYYDPANGRVFMPLLPDTCNRRKREDLVDDTETVVFGVPAMAFEGFNWMTDEVPAKLVSSDVWDLPPLTKGRRLGAPVQLIDITDVYTEQGNFPDKSPLSADVMYTIPSPRPLTVEEISHSFRSRPVLFQEQPLLTQTIPVFIRECDAHLYCINARKIDDPMVAVKDWLEKHTKNEITVVTAQRVCVRPPDSFAFVLYVTLTTTLKPVPGVATEKKM